MDLERIGKIVLVLKAGLVQALIREVREVWVAAMAIIIPREWLADLVADPITLILTIIPKGKAVDPVAADLVVDPMAMAPAVEALVVVEVDLPAVAEVGPGNKFR